jgi:hypothetical protein
VKGKVAIVSISRRTARSVRILGVVSASAALALGAAGNALACSIGDFSATAKCDGGKGAIVVTDVDRSGTSAHISLFLENNGVEKLVGEQDVRGSARGASVTFAEDWQPGATYRIHVKAGGTLVDEDIKPNLTTPATACASATPSTPASPSQSATPTPTPSDAASASSPATPVPTPSAAQSSTAAAAAPASNAPSAAAGQSNLAETGADSHTGLIAGIAAALVVVGGGAVFFGLRRRGADSGR